MAQLDSDASRLLGWIVSKFGRCIPGRPETYLGYQEAHVDLDLEQLGDTYGTSLQRQGLDALALWTREADKPAITGVVVDKTTSQPGGGYFKLFGKSNMDFRWWEDEVWESLSYDWRPYLPPSEPDTPPRLSPATAPRPTDGPQPPASDEVTSYQIVRDPVLAYRVKVLHEYRCQVCGERIALPDGRFYAEAHHIQPLGGEHQGHDLLGNMLCVCPNHHAELDLALWDIEASTLRTVPGHEIGDQYVRNHNEVIRRRWK
jgi:hypothetical protein